MNTKSMIPTSGQNQFLYFWPEPTFFIMIKPHQQGFVVIFFFTWVPTCGYVPVTVKILQFFTFFQKQFLHLHFKYASEVILVKIWCQKYQKTFKTLIRTRLQGMYWHAHKTATLTSIQHTVGEGGSNNGKIWSTYLLNDHIAY